MSTRWHSPLTEARPPSRPQPIDWLAVIAIVLPIAAFWGAVALLIYATGAI